MTWADGLLILFFLVCLGMGARVGSLWIGACLMAGFVGAFVADMYTAPVTGYVGGIMRNETLTTVVLFSAGCSLLLLPGWLLSRFATGPFLGFIDGAFGLIAGAFAGACAITVILLILVPTLPTIEKSPVWKKSSLVRPLQKSLEGIFIHERFQKSSKIAPASKEVGMEIKEVAHDLIKEIKKRK